MDDYIPDFILNLDKNQRNNYTSDSDIPDFIQNLDTSEPRKINYLDEEVKTNLGIDLDDSWSSNKEEVKKYVDSLSNEDYQTWLDWKDQWYSLDARKALMDQKDLLNTSEQWSLKYKINTPEPENWIYKYIQNLNEGYETTHPWMQSAEDWLYDASWRLEDKLGKTNLVNKYIDKYDPYSKLSPSQAEQQLNTVWVLANMVQIPKTLAQMVLNVSERAVRIFDNIQNIKSAGLAEWANLIQRLQGKEPVFNIQYGEDRSNPIGSYIQTIADWLGIWFTTAYPVATYFFSLLWAYDEKIAELENIVFSEKPEQAAKWLLNQQLSKDLIDIAWLNATDQESLKEAIADGIVLTIAYVLHMWWKKLSSSEIVRLHKEAVTQADRFAKNYSKEQMRSNYEMRDAASELPEWTEVLNDQGKPIAVSTPEGSSFTPLWAIDTWLKWIKGYAKQFKEYMQRFYDNYKKWLTPRDLSTQVWELPIVKPVETVQPKETTDTKEEVVEETPGEVQWEVIEERPNEIKATETKKVVKPLESTEATTIWEYLKKISNQITWKKGWMDEALFEKFSTSPDLQSEYINTIEPYIKANWAENPGWVIWWQLESFIDAAKDQLLARRLQNQQTRKNNRQYKIEVPAEQTAKLDLQDQQIKQLTKILSKSYNDPEKFLMYLLNLPERKINTLNELIPDFTNNLLYIKDVLDITKAITSKDLLGKFLQFKSTRWTRNRHYIRKYLYKKLNEAYKKAWVKYNMRVIENMLNQMSEQDLIELEDDIANNNIPAYMKLDFINNLYDKLDKKPIEAIEWKKIGDTTIQLSQKDKEKIINDELTKQWYRRETDTTPEYTTEEELKQHKLPDWTTIWDRMDWTKAHFSPKLFRDLRISEADFWNKAINYNRNGLRMSSFVAWHEIAHFVLGKLTTAELFDLTERIRRLTKDSGKEINRVWMWEYLADTISNYWNHWNIDWLKNLLTKNLEWPKKEITEHIQNLLETFKKDKLFQDREPRYENPRNQGWITAWERMDFLRSIDPNFKDYSFDLDVDSPTFSEMKFNMNDWKSLSREDWKNTLSHDQYLKLYSSEDLFNLEKEIKNQSKETNSRRDDIKKEINEAEAYFGKEKYEKYQKAVKDIDPDIVWLVERDWEIYVQYITESFRERYEMADRPGMVEMHVVKAKDYFTEEELNQLPKDLVSKIKKDAD